MSMPPDMTNVNVPSNIIELAVRDEKGNFPYIETLADKYLSEVTIDDKPKFYRVYKDKYDLDCYKFYNDKDHSTYGSKFGTFIDTISTSNDHKTVLMSKIIQKINKSPLESEYEYEYNKIKRNILSIDNMRQELVYKEELMNKNYKLTLSNEIMTGTIINTNNSVNNKLIDNSVNKSIEETNNSHNNIHSNNVNSNNITVKIENLTLMIEGTKLNNFYKKDENFTCQQFLESFFLMPRPTQLELMEQLQKIISYSPNLKDYQMYTDGGTEKDDTGKLLNTLPRYNKEPLGEYVISNKARFIEPQNLNYQGLSNEEVNNLKRELLNLGATEILNPDHTEEEKDMNKKNYKKLDELIKKYWDICVYLEPKTNKKAVNLKKMYTIIDSNVEDKKILDSIIMGRGLQKLFTKKVTDIIGITDSKYYVGKDNDGNRIGGPNKDPIIFIR